MSTHADISRRPRRRRRGNTIVLVTAVLVLLVIIATAFLTRTQAARTTARAINDSEMRGARLRSVAESLAKEPAIALFPQPVDRADPAVAAGFAADSSWPRLATAVNAIRYGVDRNALVNSTGAVGADGLPDYPYNFAPYGVVPWTNWPDDTLPISPWPQGIGAPGGQNTIGTLVMGERNPVGNPGFGDTRWLADAEPLRWSTGALAGFGLGHYLDAYSHWRHLSNIARPNNGYRIVTDLADVFDFGPDGVPNSGDEDGLGRLLTDLNVPVEQWLTIPPGAGTLLNTYTGDTSVAPLGVGGLENAFGNWFFNYPAVYANSNATPPNFLKLSDLDGDGIILENGERPEDEFIPNTPRWAVSRFLADTDGDGYTDSFWFMTPSSMDKGIRQLVAVRIVDNGAMLYANGATRFDRLSTFGAMPADLALVGQNITFGFGGAVNDWNTGLFDTPANDEAYRVVPLAPPYVLFGNATQRWTPARWNDYLLELGITAGSGFFVAGNTMAAEIQRARANRLAYWQGAGRRPLSATLQLAPFNLSDELELRMYHGQNYPWILSRFEQAVNSFNNDSLLRSRLDREETSEYLDQLRNRELLYDLRSKLTLYNGARNDEMPPWLRWRWDAPFAGTAQELDNFFRQTRQKLDLREEPLPALEPGEATFRQRLAPTILLALTDGFGDEGQSYYGVFPPSGSPPIAPATPDADGVLQRNRRLAAGLAANILSARDEDQRALLFDDPSTTGVEEGVVVVPRLGTYPFNEPDGEPIAFMGMEPQPFLLEAFVAHVYEGFEVPAADAMGTPWLNAGATVVFDNDDFRSTIAVVQLANPYDGSIDLANYRLEFFGQQVNLGNLPPIAPGTAEEPNTLILYAIDAAFQGGDHKRKWLDFLDLSPTNHPAGTCLVDVVAGTWRCGAQTGNFPSFAGWSTDRDDYDESTDEAIVLKRADPISGTLVVIDRIEPAESTLRDFGDAVNDLENTKPQEVVDPALEVSQPPFGSEFPGHTLAQPGESGNFFWTGWARTTRAWGVDAGLDGVFGVYGKTERNPRYVYGGDDGRTVVEPADSTIGVANFVAGGNRIDFDLLPDGNPGGGVDPWFVRDYTLTDGTVVARKPTFFDMNRGGSVADYPDKGWYQQGNDADADKLADTIVGVDDTFDSFLAPYSMQMMRKDADFLQVGELLNVWTFGHELRLLQGGAGVFGLALDVGDADGGTVTTFSEFMTTPELAGRGPRTNRLQIFRSVYDSEEVGATVGNFVAGNASAINIQRLAIPALPAGLRVLDAFVCDGPGVASLTDFNLDGVINEDDVEARRFYNAQGFDGRATPGLINVNTAPLEVLRTMPHMYRMVHAFQSPIVNPRIALPEAIIQYRERFDGTVTGVVQGPDYNDPGDDGWAARQSRGMASTSEIMRLFKPAQASLNETTGITVSDGAWQVTAAAQSPYGNPDDIALNLRDRDVILATDVNDVFNPAFNQFEPDRVAGDVEEANMLFAGLSNLVSTRSDVFTVHFRIRSFRKSEVTGRWDALEREAIVDDSRYVMLIDRSGVNRPGDQPRILYLEKLPN